MSGQTPHKNGEERARTIGSVCAKYGNAPSTLIEILHDVQAEIGFVEESAQSEIAACLNITRAEVHGVMSFYDDFRAGNPAAIQVRICRGEACQSMGAARLMKAIKEVTQGLPGVDVEAVFCLGNCALAPAALVDGQLRGRLTKTRFEGLLSDVAPKSEVAE